MLSLSLMAEGIRTAFHSLRMHPLRTVLTMLGVAVGIFAITVIFTLVDSLNYNINKNLSQLGNSVLYVHRVPWTSEALEARTFLNWPQVGYEDYRYLKRWSQEAEAVSFEARLPGQLLKQEGNSVENVYALGVTPGYFLINDYEFDQGRPFTELEADAGRAVCVLGHDVAEQLFPGQSPVGQRVRLKGRPMRVVGVLRKRGADIMGLTPDDRCFVPYLYAARLFRVDRDYVDRMITLRVADPRRLAAAESEVIGLMRTVRGLRPAAENNFAVNKPEMIMSFTDDISSYLRMAGLIISLFSVIVGGFGIGNIMFTTVKERTFEIGLQKSLGATRSFILFQFLAESVMLTLAGGVAGMLLQMGILALGSAALEAAAYDFELIISWNSMLIGALLSVFIGLASGFFPSLVAARMDPVDAMRAA